MHKAFSKELGFFLLVVALQCAAFFFFATLVYARYPSYHQLDLGIYLRSGSGVVAGLWPYRDFPLEYPPLSLVAFVLPVLARPASAHDPELYRQTLLVENMLFIACISVCVWLVAKRNTVSNLLFVMISCALLAVISSPIAPWRFDAFPALLTAMALVFVVQHRPWLAGMMLGFGVAAKIYPGVIAVVIALLYVAMADWRALARLISGSIFGVVPAMLAFALEAPGQIFSFLTYHEARGLEVESVLGSIVMLGGALGRTTATVVFNYGALHLQGRWADALLHWQMALFVGVFGATVAGTLLRFRADRVRFGNVPIASLAAAICACLLAFIVGNKVFSPQYIVWLLPFAPLLRRYHVLMMMIVFVLTMLIFPVLFNPMLDFELWPVVVLCARNLLAMMLIPWLLFAPHEMSPQTATMASAAPVRV